MFSKILVPLDGSKTAEKALPYAQHLAHQDNAEICLVFVCPFPLMWMDGGMGAVGLGACPLPAGFMENEMRLRKEYLAGLQAQLVKEGLTAVSECLEGDPCEEILGLATRQAFDLIVLTSHGRTGPGRFIMGSVAERLARHSCCPVLIVGHHSIEAAEKQAKEVAAPTSPH